MMIYYLDPIDKETSWHIPVFFIANCPSLDHINIIQTEEIITQIRGDLKRKTI